MSIFQPCELKVVHRSLAFDLLGAGIGVKMNNVRFGKSDDRNRYNKCWVWTHTDRDSDARTVILGARHFE